MADRIASLLASGTEILYGLGLGDRVVAVSHECDFPPEVTQKPRVTRAHVDAAASSRAIDEQVKRQAASGAPLYGIDVDRLATLKPDLVVTQSHCDVCAVSYDEVRRAVAETPALSHAAIVDLNPKRLADVYMDIKRVGEAAGVADRAARYIATLQARVDAIRDCTAGLGPADRPRTICIEWIDPIMVAANWMPDLVQLAGGTNGLTRSGTPSGYTDWRNVLTFDPEVLVVSPCGFDLQRTVEEASLLRERPGWSELAAVRAGRAFAVDGNAYFNRSGPRLVDTIEILAGLIHPGLFGPATACWPDVVASL